MPLLSFLVQYSLLLSVFRSGRGLQRRRCPGADQQDFCHSCHQSSSRSGGAGAGAAASESGREALQARAGGGASGLGEAGGERQKQQQRGQQAEVHGERNARLQSDG